MFPQSELDNYKLQVELLQEKLQRSEISRQQLEHKLDKIIQKRDEHDKMVRSKARQKYQQFLEEQQRRNERNKQLVQMLERIEQQTEVMNARSERLKMMKLQYEMYFAKLVHTQTRRCIQSSVNPVIQMMPAPSYQPIQCTVQQPVMERYNYVDNLEMSTPTISNPNQVNATSVYNENQSYSGLQPDKMPWQALEIPTLENFVSRERNNCTNFNNGDVVSFVQAPHLYHQESHNEPMRNNNNNVGLPTNNMYNKQDILDISKASASNKTLSSSVNNLLPDDKQFTEIKGNSNLSTTFATIPNEEMIPQKTHNLNEIPRTAAGLVKVNITQNNSASSPKLHHTQVFQETPLKTTSTEDKVFANATQNINQNTKVINPIPQNIKTNTPNNNNVNGLKTHDAIMPLTSIKLKPAEAVIETFTNSSNNPNTSNINTHLESNDQIENEILANNIESSSFPTSVSIENIENEIYGELLSPLETSEVQQPENPNVAHKLLENLVTQPEIIENKNIISEQTIIEQNTIMPAKETGKEASAIADNENEQKAVTTNYEQAGAYENYNTSNNNNNNNQQPEQTSGSYANYENADNTTIDESQQQEQQYDYSNYDPTQYTYPGYIYDEITGEYKPDPNAPIEQYATDQQYTDGGYDQQYQQEEYDYNQTYTELPATSSATSESAAYNNYDTTQQEMPSSNVAPTETNVERQPTITEPESVLIQPKVTTEEITAPSGKDIKPTSILSTAEKSDTQKKKKRVNFIDSSETDESIAGEKLLATKPTTANLTASSESDFDFSSSTEPEVKTS